MSGYVDCGQCPNICTGCPTGRCIRATAAAVAGGVEFDYGDTPQLRPFDLAVDGLSETEAYALAQMCARIGFNETLGLSISEAEARAMLRAIGKVQLGLELIDVRAR